MSLLHSLRVAGAMARITAPTLVDMARGHLDRETVDDRARWFGRRVIDVLGIDLVVRGSEGVPAHRAYVYMSNHQSHLDIPVLYASLPPSTIRMLAKKELFQIPLWGRGLRAAEFIEVDRGTTRAVQSIEHAKQLIEDGVSIWMAPEGTRSRDGRIGALKKGGFYLARETHTPIVPVAIKGTIDILPRGTKVMHPGKRVEVTIGAPIDVAGREIPALVDEVREFFRQHVEN